tara:strand:- start:23 stop:250 length:228 start_codon:yes stop_codon:yes gene_type:complete
MTQKKKYTIGIDITFGTYFDVEAENIHIAIQEAKEFADTLDRPRGCHFVGINTHSESEWREKDYISNKEENNGNN